MKNQWQVFIALFAIFTLSVFGCSKSAPLQSFSRSDSVMNKSVSEAPAMSPIKESAQAAAASSNIQVPAGRKLIYTASVEIVVTKPNDIVKILNTELANFGGYVASQDIWEDGITYEIRVPVENLNRFMDLLPNLGKIRRQTLQAQDVTDYYYDLENRVKNKRILVERYQTYLKSAKNVEDLLNIERFLNDATAELESLEGSFKGLVKQVDYATVTLTIESEIKSSASKPTLWERLRDLFIGFGSGIQSFAVIIVAILLYGIPLLVVVLLFWWLLFGKIGLLRKLFRLVGMTKHEPEKK
ncbi:MAG TPA: DUF4349 domain-containing protein [Spirochaetia bacterium]|nr:DUF4349 domain-containing protein [Spirochaetales bacterium]HRS66254.1 DUF4349 domain-containing protein [Spirochaetia bacterium]HOT58890.1 DUF4349 domain-containing protein [Spirochaetales bacterium]HPD81004.1 DUF4349 domain-containing protein [Spirochaetales bacterium]HQG39392.1 DUF4349 domain-containing protein [Spirochaetales bacterium]